MILRKPKIVFSRKSTHIFPIYRVFIRVSLWLKCDVPSRHSHAKRELLVIFTATSRREFQFRTFSRDFRDIFHGGKFTLASPFSPLAVVHRERTFRVRIRTTRRDFAIHENILPMVYWLFVFTFRDKQTQHHVGPCKCQHWRTTEVQEKSCQNVGGRRGHVRRLLFSSTSHKRSKVVLWIIIILIYICVPISV